MSKICTNILNNHGIIRKIEYLGFKTLQEKLADPANPTDGKNKLHEANFFLLHLNASPDYTKELSGEFLEMNRDVIRFKTMRKECLVGENYVCDLFEDLKPPVYRKSVIKMQEIGQKFREPKINKDPFYPME